MSYNPDLGKGAGLQQGHRSNQQPGPPPPFETTFTAQVYQGQYQQAPVPDRTFVQEVQHNSSEVTNTESDNDYDSNSPGEVSQKHLNLEYDACFHEHKKSKTIRQVHDVLEFIYKWIKLITYHFFVFLIGIPLMIVWAFLNGIMAFIYSWIWSPVLRLSIFWLAAAMPLVTMPLVAIFKPLADVIGRMFRQIRIKADLNGQLYGQPQTV